LQRTVKNTGETVGIGRIDRDNTGLAVIKQAKASVIFSCQTRSLYNSKPQTIISLTNLVGSSLRTGTALKALGA
jgi:hypothetical protein